MEKNNHRVRKILIAAALFVLVIILVGVGYYTYQLYLMPKLTKIDAPTISYPKNSVIYTYIIGSNGVTATFGDVNMPSTQVTTELETDMRAIKNVGFDGIKLNYTFKTNNYLAERIALRASQQGLYPIGLIEGFRSKPKDRAFNETEMADWLKFVKETVSANKNIIYYWEIWNEPGIDMFRYGSPEEFVQLLKATYPVIKESNPNAKAILTLGADGEHSSFEDAVLSLGAGDYFDVLSFHPYAANPFLQEDKISQAFNHEKAIVAKYNNKWPLVISEVGQPTSEVSEAEQAKLAKFVYTKAAESNVPVTWYYWGDQRLPKNFVWSDGSKNWGLIRYDGTERPALELIKPYLKD